MFNNEFYPTPKKIIDKMLEGIDFKLVNTVLEPSAGKGDIVEAIIEKLRFGHNAYNRTVEWDIDTVEINENLQHVLRGKGYRVVHNDFLTYHTYKKYNLIVMNPPFSNGEKHLLKALEMQQKGGKIVCLLNADTLDNPYSNSRKELLTKLEDYDAEIEYIENAFLDAERKTPVRIALVKVDIEQAQDDSIILNELRKEERFEEQAATSSYNQIIDADFIKGIVEQYNFEVKAGLKLIAEWRALKPLMLNTFKDDAYNKDSVLQLKIKDEDRYNTGSLENRYIEEIRMKYWRALFTSNKFMGLFTSNLREKYYNKVGELKDYDFSLFNIYTIRIQLSQEMIKAVEQTIIDLFEEFSHKHYYDEQSKNIHYYNGWKTNKSWKINKKIIIPIRGYGDWNDGFRPTHYRVTGKLTDIEKVFNYLDGGLTDDIDLVDALQYAENMGKTKKIELKYFLVTFYKKGTCHIEFTNEDLLHKFNLFGSQRKGWLPPSYGKVRYHEMSREEKQVIDEFEGESSYNDVMDDAEYFLVDSNKLLLLTG